MGAVERGSADVGTAATREQGQMSRVDRMVPLLKAFQDNVFRIYEMLTAIATETEQTAEKLR